MLITFCICSLDSLRFQEPGIVGLKQGLKGKVKKKRVREHQLFSKVQGKEWSLAAPRK